MASQCCGVIKVKACDGITKYVPADVPKEARYTTYDYGDEEEIV